MSLAHSGSTLPAKHCLPIHSDTVFLAHYDITLAESLKGIEPLNGHTATLNPFSGKFGGAAAIEESTENLLATTGFGAAQDWSKWSHWNNSAYWGSCEQYDDPIWGKVFKGRTDGASQSYTYIYDYYPYSYNIGEVYSFSCWMKVDKTVTRSFTFYINSSAGGQHYVAPTKTKSINLKANKWTYITFTSDAITENVSGTGGMGVFLGSGWEGCTIEIAYPQFERKPFSTSFVDGIRNAPKLGYSGLKHIFNGDFTFYAWTKTHTINDWRMIAAAWDKWYFSWHSSTSNSLRVSWLEGGVQKSAYASTSLNCLEWCCVAFSYDKTAKTVKIYANGKLVHTQTNVIMDEKDYDDLGIGTLGANSSSYPLNGFIDEVRIDKRVVSDEEIQQWYDSQAPFYPKGVHRIYS